MRRIGTTIWIIAVILVFHGPGRLMAQAVANATIHGVVTDASGAVVAGAQIKATRTDVGQVLNTATDSDGSYVLPNLPVGPYRLEVSAPAFSNYVQSGIIL